MSEELDPLEAELQSLRPRDVSPALQRRLAERLADTPSPFREEIWNWRLVLVGGLATVLLVTAAVLWNRTNLVRPPGPVVSWPPAPEAAVAKMPARSPTLWTYRCALAESPEALEALLDQHTVTKEVDAQPRRLRAFTLSSSDFLD